MHDVVVDAVLRVRRDVLLAEQLCVVGLVLAEQRLRCAVADQHQRSRLRVAADDPVAVQPQRRFRVVVISPRPGVAEPQRRQHVKCRLLRAGVLHRDPHQQVPWRALGVVDSDHPVTVVVEDAGVDQFVFRLQLAPPGVLGDQIAVRELALRVVVAPGVPGMGGGAVQVPPVLLDVLAVVALRPGQPEHPLLQDRVDPVPQAQRQAPVLRLVAEPRHPVLVPAVHPGARVIMREERPRVTVGAVVLAHRAPGSFGQVRSPVAPRLCAAVGLGQSGAFRLGLGRARRRLRSGALAGRRCGACHGHFSPS